MTTRTKRSAYALAFVVGFAFGIALLQLSIGLAQYTGRDVALPRFC